MPVEKLPFSVDGHRFAVSDDRRQHADDVAVGNARFLAEAVVAAEEIIVFPHSDDAVQNILPAVAPVKRDVVLFQRRADHFDDNQIALVNQRIHAVAGAGVNQLALLADDIRKACLIHLSRRSP